MYEARTSPTRPSFCSSIMNMKRIVALRFHELTTREILELPYTRGVNIISKF